MTIEQPLSRRAARDADRRQRDASRGLLSYLGAGLSAGLLGVLVILLVLVIVVPAVTGGRALTILTGSMEPTYPPGTLVVTRPTAAADITVGDVLVYQLESGQSTLVTHRVIEKIFDERGDILFTTRGDANSEADDPVRSVQVVGTVWYAIPWLGYVNTAIGGDLRPVIVPIVVVALLGYALWMVIGWARDRRWASDRRRTRASEIDADRQPDAGP